jgi:hypothetical protein
MNSGESDLDSLQVDDTAGILFLYPNTAPTPCAGDCNPDGSVTVEEILTMVNIALGNAPVDDCLSGDVNGDGMITVDEILAAVNSALNGCVAQPTSSLRFVRFDNSGITQADSVSETSAAVDIVQDACLSGGEVTPEYFTVTRINAVFRNEEAADLHLQRVVIGVGPNAGRATITHQLSGDILGGRCSNIDQQCATDADCISLSATGAGSCVHSDTAISGILLFDFDDKAQILPGTYSVIITFSASDAVDTFETSVDYVVTFEDFDNCSASAGG